MSHPLRNTKETEFHFLKRMEDASDSPQAIVDSRDIKMLIALVRHWRRLETEAAEHVESVICMRSPRFTGSPPYVGWEGLGQALREDYDELIRLRTADLSVDDGFWECGDSEASLQEIMDAAAKLEEAE